MRIKSLRNHQEALRDLINQAANGAYSIPKFQRGWVWKKPDVCNLADSILRGYPVGSLLFMPTNGTLKIGGSQLRTSGARLINEGTHYVLDGQQRLTALFKIFVPHGEQRGDQFFYDLLSMLCEQFPSHHLAQYAIDDKGQKTGEVDTDCLCKVFPRRKDNSPIRHGARFVSCDTVIGSQFAGYVGDYLADLKARGVSEERARDYLNFLTEAFSSVARFEVPVVEIMQDAPLDMVCRVFEKVNSSGRKLTPMDLLNAASYGGTSDGRHGISDYVIGRVKKRDEYRNSAFKSVFNSFMKWEGKDAANYNVGSLLKIVQVARLVDDGHKRPFVSWPEMLLVDPEKWFADWDKFEDNLFSFMKWGHETGLLASGAAGLVEFLAGISIAAGDAFKFPEFRNALLRHAFGSAITGKIFSRSEVAVASEFIDYAHALRHTGVAHRHTITPPGGPYLIEKSHIIGAKLGKQSCSAILSIMYLRQFQALFGNDICGQNVKQNIIEGTADLHHLVPRASWGANVKQINESVANIVYLSQNDNRHTIKDLSIPMMKEQVRKKLNGDERQMEKLFEANLVPFDYESDEGFLNARADTILGYVKNYLESAG